MTAIAFWKFDSYLLNSAFRELRGIALIKSSATSACAPASAGPASVVWHLHLLYLQRDVPACHTGLLDCRMTGSPQRTIAQLALTLVYKLLKGQMDESDGLDAPYNHSLLEGLLLHRSAGISVIRMYKQGSLEIRHAALSVIKLWLIHRHRPVHMDTMQQRLISLGLIPLLFGIAQAPGSSAEMRAMADACLASVHSQHNSCMGSYGTHGLLASIISITLHEQRSGTHPDKFGR